MQRASASRKSSSKKSVTLLARGMKGDVKHGANYRFKEVLFGANCWKSQKKQFPHSSNIHTHSHYWGFKGQEG